MKISLALGPRQPLSRQTAWGCFTSNMTLPGSGSLVAGRYSGYPQLALMLVGVIITMVFGGRFILWQLANWSRFYGAEADLANNIHDLWIHIRLALLGFAIFGAAWVWALVTSFGILASVRDADATRLPPVLPK